MAVCGHKANAEEAGCPDLSADDKKTLEGLLKLDWGSASDFKGAGISGKIWKANMAPFTGVWVKSDKVFEGMKKEDYVNYSKFMAETTAKDSTVKEAANTHKNADGTVCGLYVQFKMGMMIANRDMHLTITNTKTGGLQPDEMKCDEVTVWKDMPESQKDFKPSPKKVVRMKVLSFSFGMETDKGYRTVDFDNYDFSGSLPKKITAKFVGNPADFVTMAKDINDIKKNGGKFK